MPRPPFNSDDGGSQRRTAPAAAKIRFQTLDCWRGIAALLVALFHLVAYSHFSEIALVRNGWVFVDFFFVLSGFVITHAYLADLQQERRFSYFIVRRFGRLWPLHATLLGTFVLIELVKLAAVHAHLIVPQPLFSDATGTSVRALVENLFLVQATGIDTIHSWNVSSWSISTEFWAYVVFALVCLIPGRRMLAAAAIVIVLLTAGYVAIRSPHGMQVSFDYGMPRCLFGFFTGHLVYQIWSHRRRLLRYPAATEAVALALVILYASFVSSDLRSLLGPPIFGFAVWVFAFEAGPITALMRHRIPLLLGAWSYSIYMVHELVVFVIEKVVSIGGRVLHEPTTIKMTYVPFLPPDNFIFFGDKWIMDLLALLYIAVVIAIAAVTYRFVEQPARRYFNQLASERLASAVQSPTR